MRTMRIAVLVSLSFGTMLLAASCGTIGSTTCSGSGSTSDATSCSATVHTCDDGHVYSESCTGGKCTCLVDGKAAAGTTSKATTCPTLDSGISADCGWALVLQQTGA